MNWIWLHLIDNIFLYWKCLVAQLAVCVNVNSTVCFWCLLVSFSARGLACFPIGKKPPRRIYGGCRRAVFVFELSVFIFGTQTRRRRRFSEKKIKANCQAQNLLLFKNKVGLSTRPTKRFPPTHIWRWNEITPSVCLCVLLSFFGRMEGAVGLVIFHHKWESRRPRQTSQTGRVESRSVCARAEAVHLMLMLGESLLPLTVNKTGEVSRMPTVFWATQTYRPWSLAANLVMTKLPLASTRILFGYSRWCAQYRTRPPPWINSKQTNKQTLIIIILHVHIFKWVLLFVFTARNRRQGRDPAPAIGRFSSSESAALDVREVAHIPGWLNHQRSPAPVAASSWTRFVNLVVHQRHSYHKNKIRNR